MEIFNKFEIIRKDGIKINQKILQNVLPDNHHARRSIQMTTNYGAKVE